MKSIDKTSNRQQDRTKAVLPVRVFGKDSSGNIFEELVHTLDIAPHGGRLAAIHHKLRLLDQVTVQYRQHRMEFRVVWVKLIDNAREYQVGLQALEEKAAWGLRFEAKGSDARPARSHVAAAAHGIA
jgi:hypothetical protein